MTHLSPDVTLLITRDLGNLEDLATKRHTPNPVPLIAIGPAASHCRAMTTLSEVTPTIIWRRWIKVTKERPFSMLFMTNAAKMGDL
ncbi:MAG: hypothetical protein AAF609_16260 [Cyanobacteria bacterium P01_C01_bin.120]